MLIRLDSMQRALLPSMKPIPPMSAARLKMYCAPAAASKHAALSRRSSRRFSTPSVTWYHSSSGLTSTARMRSKPCSWKLRTMCAPMNPPPPVTTTIPALSTSVSSVVVLPRVPARSGVTIPATPRSRGSLAGCNGSVDISSTTRRRLDAQRCADRSSDRLSLLRELSARARAARSGRRRSRIRCSMTTR